MIISIIGSLLFLVILVLYGLLALGFPLGEYAMGGKHKKLPKKERVICTISIFIQSIAILTMMHCGRVINLRMPDKLSTILCYAFAVYLSLNIFMNLLSTSRKERIFMTPLSTIIAACFWITAINF